MKYQNMISAGSKCWTVGEVASSLKGWRRLAYLLGL